MDLAEYKAKYEGKEATPGWDAIEQALSHVYGAQEPTHWGTIIKGLLGGPDPIDGVSVYESLPPTIPHFHFCSYGFSSLYYDEASAGKDFSRFGFELTFRLANRGETRDELLWVCNLIQNIGRYVFESGKWFEEGHWIPANGPIKQECNTEIVGLAFVQDAQLAPIETPHGRVEFLQMVGMTEAELNDLKSKQKTVAEIIAALRVGNPLLVTDLNRRDG